MKIKLFIAVLFLLSSLACVKSYLTWNANERVKGVELGMTKEQVILKMGDRYIINSNGINAAGQKEEVLAYKSDIKEEYKFTLINNSLINWERVHINTVISSKDIEK